jgi:predicted nucleotidyltransferase
MAKRPDIYGSKAARIHENILYSHEAIVKFCQYWGVTELALFGSVLRDDFTEASDVDVLVAFDPQKHITLFDMVDMGEELEQIFGRKVDLVSRRSIERSENYLRREHILGNLEIIYAKG